MAISTATTANNRTYPKNVYSIAAVQPEGGMVSFMVKASPHLLGHLIQQMRDTGWLSLSNEAETLAIRADKVLAVKLTSMGAEKRDEA